MVNGMGLRFLPASTSAYRNHQRFRHSRSRRLADDIEVGTRRGTQRGGVDATAVGEGGTTPDARGDEVVG